MNDQIEFYESTTSEQPEMIAVFTGSGGAKAYAGMCDIMKPSACDIMKPT